MMLTAVVVLHAHPDEAVVTPVGGPGVLDDPVSLTLITRERQRDGERGGKHIEESEGESESKSERERERETERVRVRDRDRQIDMIRMVSP